MTKNNTGLILNFALNYGGRAEITQALKLISQDVLDAKINPGDITEELIGNYLFTQHLPKEVRDPDLIIRTSGELRLSNFLPWQGAYSELYFTDTLWPDFDEVAFAGSHSCLQSSTTPIWRSLGGNMTQDLQKRTLFAGIALAIFLPIFDGWGTLATDSNRNHSHASHA